MHNMFMRLILFHKCAIYVVISPLCPFLQPTDSAGSDGVKLCHSMEEAREHFRHLLTVEAVNGGFNEQVLCQGEFIIHCHLVFVRDFFLSPISSNFFAQSF